VKKILLLNTYYFPNGKGGAEKSTKILAEAFAKKGLKVSVITTSDKNYQTKINGVDIYYANLGNLYWLKNAKEFSILKKILWHVIDSYGLNNTKEFERILKKIRPDIILTNNLVQFSCKVWKIISKQKIPLVHILRDHYLMNMSTTISTDQNFIDKFVFGKLMSIRKLKLSSHVNCVIGISEYIIQKHLKNGYFKNAFIKSVIPNALQLNSNKKIQNKNNKKTIFGYVGALNRRKGIDLILKAFTKKAFKNKLFIYGTGDSSYIKKILKFTQQYPNIKYFGYEKPENIFKEIDCLIIPSLINESFGRVIIEAYSYGVPVIGSNRGGIPELIDEGITGYVFYPEIHNSLINTIKNHKLDKSIDAKLKKAALKKSKSFSDEIVIDQYLEIFSKLKN